MRNPAESLFDLECAIRDAAQMADLAHTHTSQAFGDAIEAQRRCNVAVPDGYVMVPANDLRRIEFAVGMAAEMCRALCDDDEPSRIASVNAWVATEYRKGKLSPDEIAGEAVRRLRA
jgi:hypothetical protein